MRTEEKVFFGIGTASFLLMLSDLLLEVFSASLFIGSKRLVSYIGILIIICCRQFHDLLLSCCQKSPRPF